MNKSGQCDGIKQLVSDYQLPTSPQVFDSIRENSPTVEGQSSILWGQERIYPVSNLNHGLKPIDMRISELDGDDAVRVEDYVVSTES